MRILAHQFDRLFDQAVKSRGASLQARGAVDVEFSDEATVLASVYLAAGLQEPGLFFQRGALYATCDCARRPYPCAHLWALLLESGDQGLLIRAYYSSQLNIVPFDDFLVRLESNRNPALSEISGALAPPPPVWRTQLDAIGRSNQQAPPRTVPTRQLLYTIQLENTRAGEGLPIALATRELKRDGRTYTKPKPIRPSTNDVAALPDAADREIVTLLRGATPEYGYGYSSHGSWKLPPILAHVLVPKMAATGRLFLEHRDASEPQPATWDAGAPWSLGLKLDRKGAEWALTGYFRRAGAEGEETLPLDELTTTDIDQFVITRDALARMDPVTPMEWLRALRNGGSITVPDGDRDAFLAALFESTSLPPVQLPKELEVTDITTVFIPILKVSKDTNQPRLDLVFRYGDHLAKNSETKRIVFDMEARRLLRRDTAAEQSVRDVLDHLAIPCSDPSGGPHWHALEKNLPSLLTQLASSGWQIDFDGRALRSPGESSLAITTGIDWFDLEGEVDYGGAVARLPALLRALERGEGFVELDDGSYGLLPTDWLSRLRALSGIGDLNGESIRFTRTQTGLLDALLAAQPEVSFDEGFATARARLLSFDGVAPAEQPAGFSGALRDYQRQGLGWLHFLDDFGVGGCLADDMGVGKTIQVLAMLENRRVAGERTAPALVVVPRSLVFNWIDEARRFTPSLRVLDHTGPQRDVAKFAEHDAVLTTYGTVRRDIASLKDVEFDYVVLDEAQAIKNASTDTAKAVRLLRGRRRLAMSGTPVENHLGELWSLFEFLNPGMLGGARVFREAGSALRNPSPETRALLGHALRPYILRRTKGQVAAELPEKTEQTVYCELDRQQRKLYNEMRDFYRASLLSRIDTDGLAKSKMHVLEALLRLRQAACHPGLLDRKRKAEPSAKLDALLGHLESVLEEGHKVLVFSQFTSLLAIVRERLDKEKVAYEYLDGRTRDRQAKVDRFQNDPACPLFLISLKAGGLGLNLTAAEYVFLLDPWWNPAVEAQAIDRAHRIGQTNQVFAYRLIAKDTVEEKVLELQRSKRDLADAIIGADNSLVRGLEREDLELLLS
ncbi:MAG: DEAD/DEAH box helicase [Bryobacteraceae bacterium]